MPIGHDFRNKLPINASNVFHGTRLDQIKKTRKIYLRDERASFDYRIDGFSSYGIIYGRFVCFS